VLDPSDCCGHDDGHFHQNVAQNPIGAGLFGFQIVDDENLFRKKKERGNKEINARSRYLPFLLFSLVSREHKNRQKKVPPHERIIPHPNFG
jgi:hypothetical protein